MEVDERLRWLESRISSSLRPRGDDLRSFFADEENRTAFLAFCNHSESRRIFVHLSCGDENGEGQIRVDTTPPRRLTDKALFFLKCSHASKLSRESIGHDVVYSECSKVPLDHLELVMNEVYLPLMSLQSSSQEKLPNDKLLDLMHRLVGAMQVTKGYSYGRVVLPMPSIEVLADAAMNSDRRAAVVHILESSVVSWMKQVKMALHLDSNSTIVKAHGKYAGPLAEVEFWNIRLSTLESVRDQMDSTLVLNILHNLEQAQSTYAQAFIHVHRDIGKAIVETEHCLMYLNTLRPWFIQLNQAYSPETLLHLFPPIMTTLLLVWQYSGVYSSGQHFQRVLHLLSNEVMLKARDIVGEDIMEQPEISLTNLKLALRVCAAFRGCYLDYRERSEVIAVEHKERVEKMKLQRDADDGNYSSSSGIRSRRGFPSSSQSGSGERMGHFSPGLLCPWPQRNSPVFATLSAVMERCNDLLELVQTVHDFRELEAAAYGVDDCEESSTHSRDPLIADIYSDFTRCLHGFQQGVKDLLSLDSESHFEELFFSFRSTVKCLEQQLVHSLVTAFDNALTLQAQLRVLEMFQGVSRRGTIKASLKNQLRSILTNLSSDVSAVSDNLSCNLSSPPPLPHIPPVACKLLWLHALKERISGPMNKIREIEPDLLEGDSGWGLRQAYNKVINSIESHMSSTVEDWCQNVPTGLQKSLKKNVLVRDSSNLLIVNFDPELDQVLAEACYLKRSPLNVRLPSSLSQLIKDIDSSELRHRQTSLQVVVQTYNEIRERLSEVEKNLFLHKLQQTEQLLCVGLDQLDWTSVAFPDFIAKARAVVCVDLKSTLDGAHEHMTAIRCCVDSWSKAHGLDMFSAERVGERVRLKQLEDKHRKVIEGLCSSIPPSVRRISHHLQKTFQCVHEASQESPAWTAFLRHIDILILNGLKAMVLKAISSLVQRATRYEQGDPIPPLLTVELELQASDVQFSPPLSVHTALVSVPEAVQKWISGYMDLAKLVPRFEASTKQEDEKSSTYFGAVCSDVEIKGAVSKINAHLETNARQCQSLRKRFTMYSFLWEQDVSATFSDFLRGQAAPHPRRFTRPETVRSRASARVHSGRPRSSSKSQQTLPTTPEANLLGVMGVSDWDFLRPPTATSEEEDEAKRPSLDDFDGEIAVFQGVFERLSKVDDISSVGWVCVDQRPAKQALSSLVSKWKHIYASHLERQVAYVLSCLERFFQEIEPKVEGISGEESDTQAFMKLMNIFNKVNAQQVEMDTKFGAVHRAVLMLDKFECPLSPAVRKQFNFAPQRWSNLKKRVALGKQRIGPRIQAKGDIISEDLYRFGEMYSNLRSGFLSSQCLSHDCPKEYSQGLITHFLKELKNLQTQAQDLIELQELLETSVYNFSLLKEFEEELATLQELWKLSESILELHSEWYRQCWNEMDSSELLTNTENELDLLSELPQKIIRSWDIYQNVLNAVLTVQANAPILERLKSPSMRPRHWKQVLRYASGGPTHLLSRGGSFDISLLEELTFGQMLEMQLHNHTSDVHAVVDRANKDISIEFLLNTFEEVWLSKQLELRYHTRVADTARQETISELGIEASSTTPKSRAPSARVTSGVRRGPSHTGAGGQKSVTMTSTPRHVPGNVPLLCNTGGIFEALEGHQTSLQSLEGTIAAASFADDLKKWHKQLQTIEAVLNVWLKVQLLWVQLEEVYSSSEVKQHLLSQSFMFTAVDTEWKELMNNTAHNTAVIAVCLKEGLLLSLEKLHTSLSQCQTALVKYVEGQRSKCPWFYYMPLEDILQFLCYSSSLEQLSAHIHKLLPHAGGLVFNHALAPLSNNHTPCHTHHTSMGRSTITGVISSMGEKILLIQGVQCEGPVEGIITKLMTSLSLTLQSQLTNVITKYIKTTANRSDKQTQFESLFNLPDVWKSNLSTQIVILATQIALDLALSKAVNIATKEKNGSSLEDFKAEVTSLSKTVTGFLKGTISFPEDVTKLTEALGLVQSVSQVNIDSNVALKASASNIHAEESGLSSSLLGEVECSNRRDKQISRHQINKFHSLQLVLSNFRIKCKLMLKVEPISDLKESFEWHSLVHYKWLSREHKCVISTLNAKLDYGYQYTGSSPRIMVTPQMEKTISLLIQTTSIGGCALLSGEEGIGKSSLVNELAVSSGHLLFTVRCSPHVNDSAVLDSIKGMITTGSWLFLHSLDALRPSILQTACSLLLKAQHANRSHSSNLHWMEESIPLPSETHEACFATVAYPIFGQKKNQLPTSVLDIFQACNFSPPNRKVFLEALFLAQGFRTSSLLATLLDNVCLAVEELYSNNIPGFQVSVTTLQTPVFSQLSFHQLTVIVSMAERHMQEFENLGLLQIESGQAPGETLQMPSMVYSEISQSTRASLRFRSSLPVDPQTDSSQHYTHQVQSLEEFALVLSLKDVLLSALPAGNTDHSILVTLLSELFPSCDFQGLLAHESGVREGMALKAMNNDTAEESARESRAASAMQTVLDENQLSEVGGTIEEQIIQSCHLQQLIPTVSFQTAVSQLVTLVQLNQFVIISGPSCSGKTSVIKVAADTLSHIPSLTKSGPVSCMALTVEAIKEDQLLGFQDEEKSIWREGLLSRCLSSQSGLTKTAITWFILDGRLTIAQLDALTSCGPESKLILSNGRGIPVGQSVRFIMEVPSLSFLTPSSAVRVASLNLTAGTISWKDTIGKWFNTQSDSSTVRQHGDALQSFFKKYVPATMDFIQPALMTNSSNSFATVSTSTVSDGLGSLTLEPQQLKLSEVHVVQSCCRILQSLLTEELSNSDVATDDLERYFIYATTWAFGSFLSTQNKIIFNQWWRETFNRTRTELCFPENGLIWDYFVKPGLSSFSSWDEDSLHFSPPTDSTLSPFVPTVHSKSVNHLVSLMVEGDCPVLLNGESGSGKTALLLNFLSEHCRPDISDTALLHLYMNHSTSAETVWDQVQDCLEWRWGRRYTPKGSRKLVCFIDDVHNTESNSACEFVRQHLSSDSYLDPSTGKHHSISDVNYVVSGDFVRASHLHINDQIDGRFLKHFVVVHWDGYSPEEISTIFDTLLHTTLCPTTGTPNGQVFDADVIHNLVQTAVQVHRKVGSMFLSTPDRIHYIFTLRNLSTVFRQLCSSIDLTQHDYLDLLMLWQRTSWWVYSGLMSSDVDRERYWEVVSHALKKYFNQDSKLSQLLEKSSRLPKVTLEQYRNRMNHQLEEYNSSHPSLHINLYDGIVEEVSQLCQVINSHHDLGHILMLGHTHPEPLVQLAALNTGHTFTQPSQHFSTTLLSSTNPFGISAHTYNVENLKKDLVRTYTIAGVKNEKILILLTDQELVHESFLTYVYQFVKGGAISPLFSKEDQSRIVTAIRSDLAQAGLTFSKVTAWKFFLSRVCSNVRMVLSLPQLQDKLKSGCSRWMELLGGLRIYTHLPWERNVLVDVALYHLKECSFIPARQSDSLAHLLASVHLQLKTRKDILPTNASYEYFTQRFVHKLSEVHAANETKSSLISSALACVSTASARAKTLQERIKREEVVLTEKSEACLKLLVQIGQDTAILKQHSQLLAKQKDRIAHLKKVIPEFEHACDLSLQEKKSLVNSSQQVVLNLDQQGLLDLRALQRPPEDIEELLVAVINVIKGPNADTTWTKGAKRLMANLDRFCELLLEFGACEDNSDIVLEALDPLVEKPTFTPEHFTNHTGGRSASQLCAWIQGVHSLHTTLQTKIRPLQSKITTMKASLSEYSDHLNQQENKIQVLDKRLHGLSVALENASIDKSRQRDLVSSMTKECHQTNQFIQSLSGIYEDWQSESCDPGVTLTKYIGVCCLSVSLAVYLSPLEPHIQMDIINNQIVPVMEEKGIELNWDKQDKFLSAFFTFDEMLTLEDEVADSLDDSLNGPEVRQQVSTSQPLSYSGLCSRLLRTLAPESFSDHWLSVGCSLVQLLPFALMTSSWNRWPLVYDPHGLASNWIKLYAGEVLISLDASDRSSKFYISLEQALVNGQTVLVKHFPCTPADPSLHPLLLLRHTWNQGANVVQLCGHRLHVHPSFQLYLTTTTPSTAIPSSLRDDVSMISCDVTMPVAQDLLLEAAVGILGNKSMKDGFRTSCEGVAMCRSQLKQLEIELIEQLPSPGKEQSYWLCTEKIATTVAKKNEISAKMESHLRGVHQIFVTKSLLSPLVKHAAMVYSIIKQLGETMPMYKQNWDSFHLVFLAALEKSANKDDFISTVGEAQGKQRELLISDAIRAINQHLLQDTARYLDHRSWTSLAGSLAILTQCNVTPTTSILLTEQLIYLQQGEKYTEELDFSSDLPPNPLCISVDLWQSIHKLPLPVEYFSSMVKTTHTFPDFWENLKQQDNIQNQSVSINVKDFPWKTASNELSDCTGLEDLVILKCVLQERFTEQLESIVSSLTDLVDVPVMSDVLLTEESSSFIKNRPVLFLYDENSEVSQINSSSLEEVVKKYLKDKTIHSVKMGTKMEGLLTELLSQPKSDCILVHDLQHASQTWLELLTRRTMEAAHTGCLLVFTACVACPHLPHDFIRLCHTALLSKLTTTQNKHLPKSIWLTEELSYTQLLQLNLASVPSSIMSKCSQLPQRAKTLVFNMSVLHTAIVVQNRIDSFQSVSVLRCHFVNLLRCLAGLISIGSDRMLDTMILIVKDVYSGCLSENKLRHILNTCLGQESTVPGTQLVLDEVEFTVPPTGLDPSRYVENLRTQETRDSYHQKSPNVLNKVIDDFLLPLLMRLPTRELSISAHSYPSTPVKPAHSVSSSATKNVLYTLEYCTEQLPTYLNTGQMEVDGSKCESISGEMEVCSQLPSSESYKNFKIQKLCSRFNSTLSAIRERDIPILTHYSRMEFDGLPHSLIPTLCYLQNGQWPQSWSVLPVSKSLTLVDGIQDMKRLRHLLCPQSLAAT